MSKSNEMKLHNPFTGRDVCFYWFLLVRVFQISHNVMMWLNYLIKQKPTFSENIVYERQKSLNNIGRHPRQKKKT